ncbi:MAG: UMP kinase [Betaproteobacteria bacterium AqS2]|uniref:Uridylate kinase n=1 Tax=Candidatus Amphirhobacter heronislandensis TaxID=1732024 RepID=A0A930UG45_9GAMM|nr:UMP kinase [Betaproteobacteria bacterium AqS2]
MKRVLLKLSGEALMCKDTNLSIKQEMLDHFATEVKDAHSMGVQIALVVGAGNIIRGKTFAGANEETRIEGDYMGMLATIINSMALRSKMQSHGLDVRLQSALSMDQVAQLYIRDKALSGLEEGKILIFAGGTGNPFFTTDTAAALRASEINADALLKGTNVDGVYDKDPNEHADSKLIKEASFLDVINKELQVMDATAITMCKDQNIPIRVFNIHEPGNLRKVLAGEQLGTTISAAGAS